MASFLRRLTTRDATGWRVWLVSYALYLADDLPFFWADRFAGWPVIGEWAQASAATTIAHAALVLVLLMARATWLRSRIARRRPAITVWTFAVATMVSTVVEVVTRSLAASDTALISLDALLYRLTALVVVAVAVSSLAEQRRMLGELLERRRELEVLRGEGEAVLTEVRGEIVDNVRQRLSDAGDDPISVADALGTVSRELAFVEAPVMRQRPRTVIRPGMRAVWSAVAVRPLLAPGLTTTVMTLLAFRSTTVATTPVPSATEAASTGLSLSVDLESLGRALLLLIAVSAATYGATWLSARLLIEAQQRSRAPLAWWVHLLVVLGAALMAQALASLVYLLPGFSSPPPFEPWMLGTFTLPIVGCSVMVGIVRAVDRHAALTRDALDAVIAHLQWDIARLNALAQSERRAVAFLLHGSGWRALRSVVRPEAPATAVTLDAFIEALRAGDPDRSRSLNDRLDELKRLWTGTTELTITIDESALLAVSGDSVSTSAITDVVTEAVRNSVTHARASSIAVDVRLSDVDLVEITVDDVATPASARDEHPSVGAPGLGSSLFDDVCVLWHRYPSATGSRLQAWVPVGSEG